jgi:hypothetical protein
VNERQHQRLNRYLRAQFGVAEVYAKPHKHRAQIIREALEVVAMGNGSDEVARLTKELAAANKERNVAKSQRGAMRVQRVAAIARAEAAEAREARMREIVWAARCSLDEASASVALRDEKIAQARSILDSLAAAPAKEGKPCG